MRYLPLLVTAALVLAVACGSSPKPPSPTSGPGGLAEPNKAGSQVRIEVMAHMLYSVQDVERAIAPLLDDPKDQQTFDDTYGRVEGLDEACQRYTTVGLVADAARDYCPQLQEGVEQYFAGNYTRASALFQDADKSIEDSLDSFWQDFISRF